MTALSLLVVARCITAPPAWFSQGWNLFPGVYVMVSASSRQNFGASNGLDSALAMRKKGFDSPMLHQERKQMTTFDDETFNKFKRTLAGCLNPNGELIACEVYQHIEVMGITEIYDAMYREYWDEANAMVQEEAEAAGTGYYHPEWHRFEIGDDTRERAYLVAYENGRIRLIANNHSKILYAEGSQVSLTWRKDDIEFLALCMGDYTVRTQIQQRGRKW